MSGLLEKGYESVVEGMWMVEFSPFSNSEALSKSGKLQQRAIAAILI
jgi:hypothetical protein